MTMNTASQNAERTRLHYLAEQFKPRTPPKARTTAGKVSNLLNSLISKELSK